MANSVINTGKVPNRPKLRFEALDQAIAHAQHLADLDRAGRLEPLGNWTLGQAMGHLAWWASAPFDGFPPEATPPRPIRVLGRLTRGPFLAMRMPAGVKLPDIPGGTFGTEPLSTDAGLAALRSAFERTLAQCPPHPSPLLGHLNHAQWKKLHCRHAELHLSFFRERA